MTADPLELDDAAIDADLRRFVAGIDLAAPGAPGRVWEAFVRYAGRPLAFGATFDDHPDNDQLELDTTLRPETVLVSLRREIGVVHVEEGYAGTIAALWGVRLARGAHWPADGDRHIAGLGITGGGLEAFRREVEASDVFPAFLASGVVDLTVMAYYV
jgi:hypothetical protein